MDATTRPTSRSPASGSTEGARAGPDQACRTQDTIHFAHRGVDQGRTCPARLPVQDGAAFRAGPFEPVRFRPPGPAGGRVCERRGDRRTRARRGLSGRARRSSCPRDRPAVRRAGGARASFAPDEDFRGRPDARRPWPHPRTRSARAPSRPDQRPYQEPGSEAGRPSARRPLGQAAAAPKKSSTACFGHPRHCAWQGNCCDLARARLGMPRALGSRGLIPFCFPSVT